MRPHTEHLTAGTVMGSVNLRDALIAARAAPKGTPLYPALIPLDTRGEHWARQDYAGGPLVILNPIPDPQSDGVVNVAA